MIEELENKVNILSVQNEKLKAENEYLRERCKNEYDGFIAVVHELCDTAMELDKYKARCEKAIEFIKEEAGYDEEIRSCCSDLLYSDCDKLIELLSGDE